MSRNSDRAYLNGKQRRKPLFKFHMKIVWILTLYKHYTLVLIPHRTKVSMRTDIIKSITFKALPMNFGVKIFIMIAIFLFFLVFLYVLKIASNWKLCIALFYFASYPKNPPQ